MKNTTPQITIKQSSFGASVFIDGEPVAFHSAGAVAALWRGRHVIRRAGGNPRFALAFLRGNDLLNRPFSALVNSVQPFSI